MSVPYTVKFDGDGSMHGHNTDLIGFASALSDVFQEDDLKEACVLGAGGSRQSRDTRTPGARCDKDADCRARSRQSRGFGEEHCPCQTGSKCEFEVVAVEKWRTVRGAEFIVNTLPIGQTTLDVPKWLAATLVDGGKVLSPSFMTWSTRFHRADRRHL